MAKLKDERMLIPTPSLLLLALLHTLGEVTSVIFPFNLPDDLLHLFGLPLPLFLPHLRLLIKPLLVWFSIASTQPIPQRRELTVVEVKIQMVCTVARSSVYYRAVGIVFAVVDEDRPDVDEDEKGDVCEFLQREEEWEEVIGYGLRKAVKRVEGVRGIRCRHDPFVVWFVQCLVDARVMQAAVDPVDETIREQDEERKLEQIVPGERSIGWLVVEF